MRAANCAERDTLSHSSLFCLISSFSVSIPFRLCLASLPTRSISLLTRSISLLTLLSLLCLLCLFYLLYLSVSLSPPPTPPLPSLISLVSSFVACNRSCCAFSLYPLPLLSLISLVSSLSPAVFLVPFGRPLASCSSNSLSVRSMSFSHVRPCLPSVLSRLRLPLVLRTTHRRVVCAWPGIRRRRTTAAPPLRRWPGKLLQRTTELL